MLFSQLIKAINEFKPEQSITKEKQFEEMMLEFLRSKGFEVTSQISKKNDRYDIICKSEKETVCIELKMRCDISDIEQFDRYLPKFRDGFIILCWQAAFSVQEITQNVKEQSPIPLDLIELSRRYL